MKALCWHLKEIGSQQKLRTLKKTIKNYDTIKQSVNLLKLFTICLCSNLKHINKFQLKILRLHFQIQILYWGDFYKISWLEVKRFFNLIKFCTRFFYDVSGTKKKSSRKIKRSCKNYYRNYFYYNYYSSSSVNSNFNN